MKMALATLFVSRLLTSYFDASPLYDCSIGKSSSLTGEVHSAFAGDRMKFQFSVSALLMLRLLKALCKVQKGTTWQALTGQVR